MDGPWTRFPPRFTAAVGKERTSLAAEIIGEIRRQVPEFARPLAGNFGAGIQQGVESALREFADLLAAGRAEGAFTEDRLRVHRALGRGELAEGRSLDALQAAYRLGGRVAWRRYARVARRSGLGTDQMVVLAEAIFACLDELASAAVRGYTEAKADEAGTLGRRRHRLLDLLVTGAAPDAVREAAATADWPMPSAVACVALGPAPAAPPAAGPSPAGPPPGGPLPAGPPPGGPSSAGPSRAGTARGRARLPDLVLADTDGEQPYLLVPEPALYLRDGQVQRALHARTAVIGPTVPVGLAADSLRWARAILGCLPDGQTGGPVDCDRCLPELLLLGDPALVGLVADRRLRPLAALTPKRAERLAETLLAWLQTHRGSAPDVAARLGIHPQTARRRLHQVQRLFGAALADPDARFELEVALRGRVLAHHPPAAR
ncbi:helix-turn-helix domain-containing protein [Actinacidiphila reveromycinica]|uniref:PucR family transcriptional regulator n=1 Tax=Actinacidiphila reveromycinica TaxID=659352 RepID=UPI00192173AE|nr:PucR family transcriptional regulator [Streptomyces sp. SN-593]